MKIKLYIIFSLVVTCFFTNNIEAQTGRVGIRTIYPATIFHVDGAGDNTSTTPTAAQALNDVVVDDNGNLGIGTINPARKLSIVTGGTPGAVVKGLKIKDGTQQTNYVLASDEWGQAYWTSKNMQVPSTTANLIATASARNLATNNSGYINTGSFITLPPGRWLVTTTIYLKDNGARAGVFVNNQVWVNLTFTEKTTSPLIASDISSNVEGAKRFGGACILSVPNSVTGSVFINNATQANKTYYLMAGGCASLSGVDLGSSFQKIMDNTTPENSIVALLVQD